MSVSRLQRGVRATFIGLTVNTLLAGTKLAAGIVGHSHALIADAVESLADVFSSLVVWRALVVADAPADEDHPYGHGKAEPIAAGIVAAVLLVAAGFIGLQAVREIPLPHTSPAPFTLVVLGVAVLLKEGLFRFVRGESQSVDSTAMNADAWHHRSDAITSLAAGLGIGVALVGGKGFEAADDAAAIIAAGIIAWNGWRLGRGALEELMDTAPRQELLDQIRRLGEETPGVHRVEKCRARKMGYHFYVDLHVEVDPQMSVQRSHDIAHAVKDKIRDRIPVVRDVLVHVEPALLMRERPSARDPKSKAASGQPSEET